MQRRDFIGSVAGLAIGAAISTSGGAAAEARDEVADFAARRRLVNTPFGKIACVERGKGPAALFIHAWPLNSFEWRGVLGPLSTIRRCIAPDVMGLGYSEIPDGQDLSPASQADMLASLLTALDVIQADIVANDSGGLIAQLFAARHPERVRSLLLTNCDVDRDNPPPSFLPVVQAAKAGVLADPVFRQMLSDIAVARSPRGLGAVYADPEALTEATVEYYLRPLLSTPLRRDQFHRYTITLGHNDLIALQPKLRQLSAPVRIVWGAADTVFDKASPEVLDGTFPNSHGVRRIPDAKGFFPEERPEIIVEEACRLWT